MFFIFSKLLIIFICPLTWVFVLAVAALLIKKQQLKRRLLIVSVILLYLFSIPALLNLWAKKWDIAPTALKKSNSYSCAIVLGGFSSEDANGNGFFNGAADRFVQGLKLLTTGKVSHILISGGNAAIFHDEFEESDWVEKQLKEFKIPDSCVLIENRSRNTIENAAFSKILLNKRRLQPPYVLVTSAFHMRRSIAIFDKAGLPIVPYPCNYITGTSKFSITDLTPDADTLSKWNTYIKELIGSIVNYLRWHF